MGDNEGNAIVVTGAGSGIGKATVNRLANDGANVVAVDLAESSLDWTKEIDSVTPLAGCFGRSELRGSTRRCSQCGSGSPRRHCSRVHVGL